MQQAIQQRYVQFGGNLKIGIAWRTAHPDLDATTSLVLNCWDSILSVPNLQFINLQYGDCLAEITQLEKKLDIEIYSDPQINPLKQIDEFAAQISILDLIITIDNSTAVIAAALGKPTWILLPYVPQSMWLLKRDDSSDYPSIKLFRQQQRGDWYTVVESVQQALVKLSLNFHQHH